MDPSMILEFEKPIYDIYTKIDELKALAQENGVNMDDEITKMQQRADSLKKKIFKELSPIQTTKLARHQLRPTARDYIDLIFQDFHELHGDRLYGDDPAMIGGLARFNSTGVMIIGQQKGKDTKDNLYRNFGMPHPEGYRKALRLMKLADKFNLPIITLVDTPGAFPGIGAEERGQAEAIARNLKEMFAISSPILTIVTGEGGSGGALALAVANKVLMLQYAIYSVISPEGCASILWRDATKADEAAAVQKITAPDLLKLKIIEGIIKEPLGGAHNDHKLIGSNVAKEIETFIKENEKKSKEQIINERYEKFRKIGQEWIIKSEK